MIIMFFPQYPRGNCPQTLNSQMTSRFWVAKSREDMAWLPKNSGASPENSPEEAPKSAVAVPEQAGNLAQNVAGGQITSQNWLRVGIFNPELSGNSRSFLVEAFCVW